MILSAIPKGKSISRLMKLTGDRASPYVFKAVRRATNIVLREWVDSVDKSTAKEGWKKNYVKSINIEPQSNLSESVVSAEGMFVNFVEKGIKKFDMKPGLLKSDKVKPGKNGPYIIVSFRHGTPGSQHMGPTMPKEIHRAMQKIKGNLLQHRIRSIRGLKDYKLPSKYKGMIKQTVEGHEQYRTFRVVTKDSKGWMYPGATAVPVYNKVKQSVKNKIRKEVHRGLIKDIQEEAGRMT